MEYSEDEIRSISSIPSHIQIRKAVSFFNQNKKKNIVRVYFTVSNGANKSQAMTAIDDNFDEIIFCITTKRLVKKIFDEFQFGWIKIDKIVDVLSQLQIKDSKK